MKFNVQVQRIKADYNIIEIEADSPAAAAREARKLLKADLDRWEDSVGGWCDGETLKHKVVAVREGGAS